QSSSLFPYTTLFRSALMAMARFNLKMAPGISRPALAALWPTLRGESVVLDVGASIGADASHLIDLAIMGGAMARVLFDQVGSVRSEDHTSELQSLTN